MSRDKQNEIHELAKQMSEAISTEVEQKYIMEEAKLEAVLRANGWVKAEEIFAEIEKLHLQKEYIFAKVMAVISWQYIDLLLWHTYQIPIIYRKSIIKTKTKKIMP